MASRNIRGTGIDKLTVHFVGEKEKIILLHQVTDLVHLTSGIQIAGRIIRITDQDTLGTFVDQLFKFLYFRKREPLLNCRSNGAYFSSGRNGKSHIVGVSRFGNNDLVSRIKARHEWEKYSFGTSGSNDYIICCQVDIEFLVISY